ncbi:DNA mismatch repair protein, partial [Enterococcus faecium]
MGQREFIVLIIIAVVILLDVLDIFSRLKVKETVRSNRGKIPYQPRFDKEESLKDAWHTE